VKKPKIVNISPKVGSNKGGTIVIFSGSGFASAEFCVFGSILVNASVSSDGSMTCITPLGLNGSIFVGIAFNENLIYSSILKFSFVPMMEVTTILPIYGPETGG
jgi:hypothetical protein